MTKKNTATHTTESTHLTADELFVLGVCYEDGLGVARSYEEAVHWYTVAAEAGIPEAQCNLGVCYEDGLGVARSYEAAAEWYAPAAEAGLTSAQYNLAELYEKGLGVDKSLDAAIYWYTAAAEEDEDARLRLAELTAK